MNMKSKLRMSQMTFCLFVTNFERHIVRNHPDYPEVQEFLNQPKKSHKRKEIIRLIRNAGNFNQYLKGNVMPIYRIKITPPNEYYSCAHCKGMYKKSFLYRHAKICHAAHIQGNFGKLSHLSASQTVIACALDTNHTLDQLEVKEKVFSRMRADDISMVAKSYLSFWGTLPQKT